MGIENSTSKNTIQSKSDLNKEIKRSERLARLAFMIAGMAVVIAIIFSGCTLNSLQKIDDCEEGTSPTSSATASQEKITNGKDGKGAYEEWLNSGNSGTAQDFLDYLKGADGKDGDKGDKGDVGPQGEQGVCTVGESGANGAQGPQGEQGIQGPAGTAFTLKGSYDNLSAFNAGAGASEGVLGEGWLLSDDGSIMVWSTEQGWIDAGDIRGAQGPVGAQGIQGIQGIQGPAGISGIGIAENLYGYWFSGTTQTARVDTPTRMHYGTSVSSRGVLVERGSDGKYSDILFKEDGVYNLQFSAQFHNSHGGGSGHEVLIWLGKNGFNVPFSATNVSVNSNSPYVVASWNFFIDASAGDTAQIFWQTNTASISIEAEPSNGTPAIPSVILTVNRVG
jgi:hypothetical protein